MIYSKIILTNLPAFYKINLFNKIAETEKILVIFTGNNAEIRNSDFFKENLIKFDFSNLKGKSLFYKFYFLTKIFISNRYSELIIGGWDEPLLLFSSIISKKRKNSVIVESSIYESKITGAKSVVKKLFLSRINKAYASGKSQINLLKALGFKGIIKKTKGVGIFNVHEQPKYEERARVFNFLYVGRLSKEKNLEKLIKIFPVTTDLILNIVGFGPEEDYLKSIASQNIHFHGAINNSDLHEYYKNYDVFILPSLSEPWGLVVEEALNNGMPVIVSNKVGCADEIVIDNYNGIIADLNDENSLLKAIQNMNNIDFYNSLRENISKMDFTKITEEQVNTYLN
ncbi:Glycosyltransferase involved in cell wall bisynthesis [Chryseobacterium formosense]|uniref:glycosyltransferase n=1 Tax=Chryseobacterium formosense TaxID=236814 RepID=UPI00068DA0C5|nr:glycosyltransferase [Chryseobacterium formosense]SFT33155.1 Glycosyltransferase involved in cell wall bisynthesis [Chryseobacterium formosense]